MNRSIDPTFYKRKAWLTTRELYLKSVDGLCEQCLRAGRYTPAEHVHHKIHLNNANVDNPLIAYGFDNLEALCLECHNREHLTQSKRRYSFDEQGNIVYRETNDRDNP